MALPQLKSKLELHGAAATSSPHSLVYLPSPDDSILYASNCIVNIAKPIAKSDDSTTTIENGSGGSSLEEGVLYNVNTTLRTSTVPREKDCMIRSITTMTLLKPLGGALEQMKKDEVSNNHGLKNILVCAFSDGSLTLWKQRRCTSEGYDYWEEDVVIGLTETDADTVYADNRDNGGNEFSNDSITDVDGVYQLSPDSVNKGLIQIQAILLTSSSKGVHSYTFTTTITREHDQKKDLLDSLNIEQKSCLNSHRKIANYPTSSIKITTEIENQIILSVGTAQPRQNRIHFYTLSWTDDSTMLEGWKHQGSLLGHLGWVTCLDWLKVGDCMLLASGSHDSRIRLWKFHPPNVSDADGGMDESAAKIQEDEGLDVDSDEEDEDDQDDLVEEGEARMHIRFEAKNGIQIQIAVTLEALLIGHEEKVTAVSWRPLSSKPCLISSSMDRSILIWMEENDYSNSDTQKVENVVWAPVTRVGTAGGILGGSVGSSLLGFLNVLWNGDGSQIIGHGYGGSIYFWSRRRTANFNSDVDRWRANPCITGHFRGCSDISWEASEGLYLLSAGLDQTCRLWTYLPGSLSMQQRLWREVGRPQVHGYDLNTVACIGNGNDEMKYRFVSGADEKEARAFDAPVSTLKLLGLLHGKKIQSSSSEQRVERAFIPSLGLSNRATADDAMEEDSYEHSGKEDQISICYDKPEKAVLTLNTIVSFLPHERDLGVVSLWPEVRKLYGHQSELVCLVSNAAQSNIVEGEVILASSCKARDAVNASIRLWNVNRNMCVDVLKDGHKATVTSMSFSSDGKYLASSGKDRRLCLWKKRDTNDGTKFDLSLLVESAHKRIVWSLDFCPHDPSLLCTGSRDGYLKLWCISEADNQVSISELYRWEPSRKGSKKTEPITAVAFAPRICQSSSVLAVGLENGLIELWAIPLNHDGLQNEFCRLIHSIPTEECHIGLIKKLAWQPASLYDSNIWDCTLASCSIDHGVRIHRVKQEE